MSRGVKRFVIIIFYLIVFFLLGTVVYFMAKPDPTCFDGAKNQGEEQVDCGGPCAPCSQVIPLEKLEVVSEEWVKNNDGTFDLVMKIKNPNDLYGAKRYDFVVTLNSETKLEKEDYILPAETKSIVIYNVDSVSDLSSIDVAIDQDGIVWKKFVSYREPNLAIKNSRFEAASGGETGFGRAMGTLVNRSDTDFETINVKVILRGGEGNLLAVNSQVMNTVRAGEHRDYSIGFSEKFSGSVERIDVEAETNIFDSENYIRIHGDPKD